MYVVFFLIFSRKFFGCKHNIPLIISERSEGFDNGVEHGPRTPDTGFFQ